MYKKLSIILSLIFCLFLIGCNDNTNNHTQDNIEKDVFLYGDYIKYTNNNNPVNLEILQKKVKKEYDDIFVFNYEQGALDFFNINNKITITINISNEELEKLNNDHSVNNKDVYRICNLDITINDILFHYEQVGIRQKGNTSRGYILDENGNVNLRHYKISFTETFDDEYYDNPMIWNDTKALEYRENRSFFGLEKLNFRWNRNQESTYIREYYAFEMYRNNGVLAPHSNPFNLSIVTNGTKQNMGIYLAVEDIDKGFIKRNFVKDEQKGDLYKLGWSNVGATFDMLDLSLIGVEDQIYKNGRYESISYPYDLKTNKKTSTHEALKSFINKIVETPAVDYYDFFNFDILYSHMINYLAVGYLLGDPDDLRGNFNNTYLYFTSKTNKAIFIPTDNDRVLGSTGGSNPTGHYGALTSPFSDKTGYAEINDKPLWVKSIVGTGNDKIKKDYLNKINEIANSKWMTIDNFKSYYSIVKNNYSNNLKLGNKVNGEIISFSLDEEKELYNSWNLSIEVYLNIKKNTALNFNAEALSSKYYLRGQMNNWDGITEEYNLKVINGIPTIEIYLNKNQSFKIASDDWSLCFEYTHLIDSNLFEAESEHLNIKPKESGLYKIEILDINGELMLSIKKQ